MSADVVFTLIYFLLSFCIIFPPTEFVSAGFTIPQIFSVVLGSEVEEFVFYHIRRSCLTLFIYSLLPIGFIFGTYLFGAEEGLKLLWFSENFVFGNILTSIAIILPLGVICQLTSYGHGWKRHPIALNLQRFANNNSSWKNIASDINSECRRFDKVIIQTSSLAKLVATENWIIKITPLHIFIAHQTDSELTVKESDSHTFSHLNRGETQFITIEVSSSRTVPFKIRLNSLDFRELQDRVSRTITVLPEIRLHKNVIDKFLEAFRETIKENKKYVPNQELENCIGCMQNKSDVKIQKLCQDANGDNCTNCYCKPMWCVDCTGKWFAHRQDASKVDTWLSSKCTCPMCRATFCLLDVCLVDEAGAQI